MIQDTVESVIAQVKLTTAVNQNQLSKLMQYIYGKIEQKLFQRDPMKVKEYEVYMGQDNLSVDSLDPD